MEAIRTPVPVAFSTPVSLAADLSAVEWLMREMVGCNEMDITGRAADHHLASGGSRTRAVIALQFSRALGLDHTTGMALAAASELIHNASLIHDDIQDHSLTRRGREALWVRFGSDIALSVGDLFVSAAWAALGKAELPSDRQNAVFEGFHHAVRSCIRGQNDELALRAQPITIAHYEQIVAAKSGALLGLPANLALLAARSERWCGAVAQAARRFSTAYQVFDDLGDVESDRRRANGQCCLNIVLLLADQGVDMPRSVAARLARLRLDEASDSLEALPAEIRSAFMGLIEQLRARLPA